MGIPRSEIDRALIDAGDPQSGSRCRFRFVFVSCERAGEAKLCGRVRGECLSTLGVSILTFPPAVGFVFV